MKLIKNTIAYITMTGSFVIVKGLVNYALLLEALCDKGNHNLFKRIQLSKTCSL